MFKIRTYNAISAKGIDRFPHDRYEIASEFAEPDAFILRSQKLHDEPLPGSVVAAARAGAGVNNIPIDRYAEQGVVVFNTPGANANAVKELIIAALLLGSRDIFGGMQFVQGIDPATDSATMSKMLEKEKKRFAGSEVHGKTLGIVGLGAIGSMVANLAIEMGMKVVGYDPAISVEAAWQLSSRVKRMENLQSLLARADYVSLNVPMIEQTRHLINAETVKCMRPGATLINFAREGIVDTAAVIAALDAGQLARYVSDFPTPELLGRKNAILMPHIGASTAEAEENCAVMAADQLMDFLENGNIRNSVNFPQTRMGRAGDTRITFCNRNVPKVLGSVLGILADRNINVVDMVNKSRNEIAYNIIDVESEVNGGLADEIAAVEGVIRVRIL